MAREFIVPGQMITGAGALEMAQDVFGKLGTKALIVTDQVMIDLGNCAKVENALEKAGVAYSVYAGIAGEPTDTMIETGVEQYRKEGCDFLVALGGGSPIDSMKAIAALRANGGQMSDYMGMEITGDLPKMAAIPTTAGTGSEATQFTIITDTKNQVKMLLKGKDLIPDLAVIDPQFTMTAPPKITTATGLDALCHAVESYTSRKAQPLSDTFALSAIQRIFTYLPQAYEDGQNEQARIQMSIAAMEAGIAFNNASVTLIHGMSRPIGALFHIAHGISNAMLMNVCLEYALEGTYERFGHLGRLIGVADDSMSDQEASQCFLDAINALVKQLAIPTLEEYGVDRDTFFELIDKMAKDAMESGSPQNTQRDMSEMDVKILYQKLWEK